MNDVYISLADGFEKLAAGYRTLAKENKTVFPPIKPEKPEITIDEVRAVFAKKSEAGKTRDIKALLMKYDAGKLSGVKPEDYPALLKEAEAL